MPNHQSAFSPTMPIPIATRMLLLSRSSLSRSRPRLTPCAIARRVSDLRHYPPGTGKEEARAIRAKRKREALKARRIARETPQGYGDRPGAGIHGYGSAERTEKERETRLAYAEGKPGMQKIAQRYSGMLSGGPADHILHVLRARWLERTNAYVFEDVREFELQDHVKKAYQRLIDEILLCDSLYYADEPKPRLPDHEYDELVMHLIELERCFPQLISPRSPTQNVGHGAAVRATKLAVENETEEGVWTANDSFAATVPLTTRRFPQHKHRALMLSLDNAYKHEHMVSFATRAQEAGSKLAAELKIDGVALSLEYRYGQLHLAASRGTGRIGDEVTENVKATLLGNGIVEKIEGENVPAWMLVRGEVYITMDDLEEINRTLEKPLSNPRNAAAGALKHKDPEEAKKRRLRFIAYECLVGDEEDLQKVERTEEVSGNTNEASTSKEETHTFHNWLKTHSETIGGLAKWGFGKMPRSAVFDTLEEAEQFAARMEVDRGSLPMEVDGIVFKFESSVAREEAGHTARAPRGAIAYKFAAQSRITSLVDVVMQVSRNGIITPVAVLNPIRVGGALLSRATLHNFNEIERLQVAVGDEVRIERGGDVIPKIVQVVKCSDSPSRRIIEPPQVCPCCQGEIKVEKIEVIGTTTVSCANGQNCTAQSLGRLLHFCSRDAMDIRGLGLKTATKLVESGIIVLVADLFRLTFDDIISLEGFAKKSARQLFENIKDASTSRSLEQIFVGLGLPGIGQTSARDLALKAGSLKGLLDIATDENGKEILMGTPNIAEKTADTLHEYMQRSNIQAELKALETLVTPKCTIDEEETQNIREDDKVDGVVGKSFAFTGKFVSINRPQVMKWIRESGGRVMNDVSKKTDYLIVGAEPGQKFFKAQRLKCPVVPESDFLNIFSLPADDAEALKL